MAPRLKVFVTSNGFTDSAVAVSSRAKALAAWGVSQDLFKEGSARESDDPALTRAALERPGEVVERTAAAHAALAKGVERGAPKRKAGPSKAALKRVADLEAELKALDAAHAARLADIAAEREALDRRETRAREGHAAERGALEAKLERARGAV